MTNYTDEELMSFVRDHDVSAFEELFGRYERRIFAFFYRLFWNTEDARECTQETFLRLWRGRAMYAPTGKFTTYIFQIAKNHFLHERDRKQHRVTLTQSSTGEFRNGAANEPFADSAFDQAAANELGAAISKAVAGLPELHRLVYVLSEEQRLSYKEIAEILDCPVGTVSSRKVEAIRKLRKMLEPLKNEVFGSGRKIDNSEVSK
jgi:RNA polymerase sigma-70 factor (ECF subfamily)